jgi:hypothetical protein
MRRREENAMKLILVTLTTIVVMAAPALACCPGCP